MKLCPTQEICIHYSNNTKRRPHHVRVTDPCCHWLAYDCEKIWELLALQEYCTGKPSACEITKGGE